MAVGVAVAVAVATAVAVAIAVNVAVAVAIAVGVLVGVAVLVGVGQAVGGAVGLKGVGWATAVAGGGAGRQPAITKLNNRQIAISRINDCVAANTLWARVRRSPDQRE